MLERKQLSPPERRRARRLAAVLLLTLVVSCQPRAEELFSEATRQLANDEAERSARLLREVVLLDPSGPLAPRAQFELARIQYLRLRDIHAARDRLVRLLQEYPESDVARPARRLLAGVYARELADPARALGHYLALAENEPDVAEERRNFLSIADCYYRLDQLSDARSAYRHALSLPYAGESDAAYLRLARLEEPADPERALNYLAALERRTADETRRYEASLQAIDILIEAGRFSDARTRLRATMAWHPASDELSSVQSKLHQMQRTSRSPNPDAPELEALQERIHWGRGRAARRTTQQ